MAAPAVYEDFNFVVQWGGTNIYMMSVSPLVRSNDVLEYRDGGDKLNSPKKAPGITRYEPIVLERRLVPADTEFYQWAQQVTVVDGNYTDALRDVRVEMLDGQRNPVATFIFTGCWPSSYEISGLNGDGSAFVVERLTLEYDYWTWEQAPVPSSGGTSTGGPHTH
jgi:phage tail-like protein